MILSAVDGRCEGHGLCITLAPDLLDLDDDGLVEVTCDVVPDDQEPVARLAVESCPAQALRVD